VQGATDSSESKLKDAVVLYVDSPNAIVNNINAQIEKDSNDVSPFVKNGRTLVPVRFITEALGAKVDWESKTRKVIVEHKNNRLELIIDSKNMFYNGKEESLEVASEIRNGRTFVPLRKLAEALGKKVFYDRGLIIISNTENVFSAKDNKEILDRIISRVNSLPSLESFENFKKIVKKNNIINNLIGRGTLSGVGEPMLESSDMFQDEASRPENTIKSESAPMLGSAAKEKMESKSVGDTDGSSEYSKTNTQVQGVDEGDIIKTDGKYIYQVNGEQVIIVKAYPANEMEVMSQIKFGIVKNYVLNPVEMYIDGNLLTVISGKSNNYTEYQVEDNARNNGVVEDSKPSIMPYPYYKPNKQYTNILVYDISDIKNPQIKRDVDIEGNYVSSRKINSFLYVVSNKYINTYQILNEKSLPKENDIIPTYRDSVVSPDFIEKQFSQICYFPDFNEQNIMNIAGLDLTDNTPVNVYSIMGAGNNIYASSENLYVALGKNSFESTSLFKFSLNKGKITFLYKGEVNGRILNQFSMDESGNYFRIATTTGNEWETSGENISKNNIFILDETLKETGKIENIAPGERIYSVRFMGAKAYMVTFKKVDPLFVIDLSNPVAPKILGKLKIPGFSDYLHPYDENHIIGFGKDTMESKDSAYYLGFKMAIFDVSDVNNPKQKFVELIGDRGTTSDLLQNHKALMFSREKNLLAFPITVMKTVNNNEFSINNGASIIPEYGSFEFQGAYVYSIDPNKGFVLNGKITHLSEEELLKAGQYYVDFEKSIQRILYIDDNLYTASNRMLKANRISNLKEEIGSIKLK
jgi:uncharacterized secreted protein with C-terminal beta-propeller domain